jgi:hypothetical protein
VTTVLITALVLAIVMFTCSALVLIYMIARNWREDRRWHRERRRLAEYHERKAADNGRPHTEAVMLGATRREP